MTKQTLHSVADALDRSYLDMIQNGKPYIDEDGQEKRRPLNAAEFNAINARLKACNITAADTPGSVLDRVKQSMKASGLKLSGDGKLPEIDLEDTDVA